MDQSITEVRFPFTLMSCSSRVLAHLRRKGCHRCLVMYEKHRNVLQYKESECEGDNMYMDQSNPAAMPMREQQPQRSILNSDHRGGSAHPNNANGNGNGNNNHGHARVSSSDSYSMRSHDDATNDCKHFSPKINPYQKPNQYPTKKKTPLSFHLKLLKSYKKMRAQREFKLNCISLLIYLRI